MKKTQYKYIKTTAILLLLSLFCGCTPAQTPEETVSETKSAQDILREQTDTCQIVIPGISRDYHLLFLTDTHITIPSDSDTQEEHTYTTERLNHFTAESGYAASELFTAWMENANEEGWDGLLLGGDIIDCPTAANMQYLNDSLNSLKIPYLYAPGNHDWTFPWEYMTETGTTQYLSKLSPYMENNTAIHTLEYDDFTVVAVDNSNNQIHPDALEEYQNILTQGKPVIVMLHVPFYTEELLAKTSQVWGGSVVLEVAYMAASILMTFLHSSCHLPLRMTVRWLLCLPDMFIWQTAPTYQMSRRLSKSREMPDIKEKVPYFILQAKKNKSPISTFYHKI